MFFFGLPHLPVLPNELITLSSLRPVFRPLDLSNDSIWSLRLNRSLSFPQSFLFWCWRAHWGRQNPFDLRLWCMMTFSSSFFEYLFFLHGIHHQSIQARVWYQFWLNLLGHFHISGKVIQILGGWDLWFYNVGWGMKWRREIKWEAADRFTLFIYLGIVEIFVVRIT